MGVEAFDARITLTEKAILGVKIIFYKRRPEPGSRAAYGLESDVDSAMYSVDSFEPLLFQDDCDNSPGICWAVLIKE